jgi:hypothetical protein
LIHTTTNSIKLGAHPDREFGNNSLRSHVNSGLAINDTIQTIPRSAARGEKFEVWACEAERDATKDGHHDDRQHLTRRVVFAGIANKA